MMTGDDEMTLTMSMAETRVEGHCLEEGGVTSSTRCPCWLLNGVTVMPMLRSAVTPSFACLQLGKYTIFNQNDVFF